MKLKNLFLIMILFSSCIKFSPKLPPQPEAFVDFAIFKNDITNFIDKIYKHESDKIYIKDDKKFNKYIYFIIKINNINKKHKLTIKWYVDNKLYKINDNIKLNNKNVSLEYAIVYDFIEKTNKRINVIIILDNKTIVINKNLN